MEARSFAAKPAGTSEINYHQIRIRFSFIAVWFMPEFQVQPPSTSRNLIGEKK
ncbi:hypothetical protein T01_13554 [Trichinella spiralis]|uniref:Uncharacterized protein n=1 Tax=Trichinella spiralis TaxID=6334 RepID=A0A0V1ANT0_TRISP|nr:hypothetical protein T01_575 [Trichinella spiralis]KRY26234.1 hypothetical protein T01_13554 [Trichinella spiralis]